MLSGFTGHLQEGLETDPLEFRLGNIMCHHPAILVKLHPEAEHILGSDLMRKCNLSFDPANCCIWQMPTTCQSPVEVATGRYVDRISTFGELWIRPTEMTEDPEAQGILAKHTQAFASHKHDCGRITGEVIIEGPDPKPQRQYGFPKQAEGEVAKVISSLLKQGVLRPVASTNNSPIWPVRKPDGSWRLTIDYRALNQTTPVTAPTVATSPEAMMKQAPHAKLFTVLDISNGFWSIPLDHHCQYKFAFTFQGQQYTWTCLPQGFHNSPSIFHQRLAKGLEGFSKPECLVQYVDDLLLQTETRGEHLKLLDELLNLLTTLGFKVNPKKVQIMR